jgi:hypothetical protein
VIVDGKVATATVVSKVSTVANLDIEYCIAHPASADCGSYSMDPIIELKGVSKQFGKVVALDDISFQLYPSEVHCPVW